MTKRPFLITAMAVATLLYSCGKDNDPFLITKTHVGQLKEHAQESSLDSLYSNDSIVKEDAKTFYGTNNTQYKIYEKGGKALLELTVDTSKTVVNVNILDDRFQTEKKLSKSSTFKEIKDHYTISSISNTMNNVVVFVDDLNAYFTISKDGLNLPMSGDIEAKDIPDTAKIKYFMMGWQ
ncbi:hypothetical protein ACG2LH_00335 [Zhouia sp. PK063]|uniref:hypothetical protein n=1 Tax=Zhouia sp. PK063 TaxID=3373602 RepID=UPI00378D7246